MRKALLAVTIAVVALLWAGHSQMAYAVGLTTYSCQGHDTFPIEEDTTIANAALWSVTTQNGKFTGGFLIATFDTCIGSEVCFFELDTGDSAFESEDGFTFQLLDWEYAGGDSWCPDYFEDEVSMVSSGTQGVMNDFNLDDDDAPGAGTCIVK